MLMLSGCVTTTTRDFDQEIIYQPLSPDYPNLKFIIPTRSDPLIATPIGIAKGTTTTLE